MDCSTPSTQGKRHMHPRRGRTKNPITSHALQLRQAKLSFSNVHLLAGVFSDARCEQHGHKTRIPQLERCELIRHCRWVDEVVEDAPWRLDEAFLNAHRIDYVAIDEGASIDPAYDKERIKGYDLVKSLREYNPSRGPTDADFAYYAGKAIPTRPTAGLTMINLAEDRRSETPLAAFKSGTIRGKPAQTKSPIPVEEPEMTSDPFQEPLADLME